MSSSPKNPVLDLELMKKRLNLLTARQRLVLRLEMVNGLPNQKEIGKQMGIGQGSVSDHRRAALENLGVRPEDATGLAVIKLALEQTPITLEEQEILDEAKKRAESGRFGEIEKEIVSNPQSPPPPQPNWRMLGVAGAAVALGLLLGWLLFGQTRAPQPAVVERTVVATPTPGPSLTPVVITQMATPNATQIAAAVALLPTFTPPPPVVQKQTVVATPTPGPTQTPWVITATPEPTQPGLMTETATSPPVPTTEPAAAASPTQEAGPPVLEVGQAATSPVAELTLLEVKFATGIMYTKWKFTNTSNQQISAWFGPRSITVKDNIGQKYTSAIDHQTSIIDQYHCSGWDALVEPGQTIFNAGCEHIWLETRFDTANCKITEMLVIATNVTRRIPEARWRIPINLCG